MLGNKASMPVTAVRDSISTFVSVNKETSK